MFNDSQLPSDINTMIATSDWTLKASSAKHNGMVNLDDNREITILLAISVSSELFSPQIFTWERLQDAIQVLFPHLDGSPILLTGQLKIQ